MQFCLNLPLLLNKRTLCLVKLQENILSVIFSSPEPKAQGELVVYQSSCRLCVCLSVCVCVSVNIFKLEYLRNQWANRNEILSEPSLGWGKGCIKFWARSDRNSGVYGNG